MWKGIMIAICCLAMVSCDADSLGYVEKAKYDALEQQLKKAESDLKTLQQQVSECQSHKYQVYREGLRTWRLDTVTGETCLLLASEGDWKNPKTASMGCN